MPIEDRNLATGSSLVATYKKQRYVCRVEMSEEDQGLIYVLEDGTQHRSPSAAASTVMGGKAVNGWRFWSLADYELGAKGRAAEKAGRTDKAKKLNYKVPNQRGVDEGKSRWFCSACMKSFLHEGDREPEICPEDHRANDRELMAVVSL